METALRDQLVVFVTADAVVEAEIAVVIAHANLLHHHAVAIRLHRFVAKPQKIDSFSSVQTPWRWCGYVTTHSTARKADCASAEWAMESIAKTMSTKSIPSCSPFVVRLLPEPRQPHCAASEHVQERVTVILGSRPLDHRDQRAIVDPVDVLKVILVAVPLEDGQHFT